MSASILLEIAGEEIPVKLRRNAQAKRMVLRVDRTSGDIKVTIPKCVSDKAVVKFLNEHRGWIVAERENLSLQPVRHGVILPFQGREHELVFTDSAPRKVFHYQSEIKVGGPVDMAAGRLEKWLRGQAKQELHEASTHYAEKLNVSFSKISIGDMKSRWGSCSSGGTLRYNWRLIMAPPPVLKYVAAHEISHLLEMNHSEYFWQHVAHCMPEFDQQRAWLKRQGGHLFSYRFS